MLPMLLINKDINNSPILMAPKWTKNQTWEFKLFQIEPIILLILLILVLVWPNKKWLTILVQSPNPVPNLSWKLYLLELIFLWLVNSVSVSILLISSLKKSRLFLNPMMLMFNTDGNPLLVVLFQLLKTLKTQINLLEVLKSFLPWKLIILNSWKKEELKI